MESKLTHLQEWLAANPGKTERDWLLETRCVTVGKREAMSRLFRALDNGGVNFDICAKSNEWPYSSGLEDVWFDLIISPSFGKKTYIIDVSMPSGMIGQLVWDWQANDFGSNIVEQFLKDKAEFEAIERARKVNGGFDFEMIEIPENFAADMITEPIYHELLKVTDIPERLEGVKPTTVQKMGYWEANRYFTMHLKDALTDLGYEPFENKMELVGNTICQCDENGFEGFLNDHFVFCFGHIENLEEPIRLMKFKELVKGTWNNILENAPIILFQHYRGPIIAKCFDTEFELEQDAYSCHNDAVVFRGVYRAIPTEQEDKYRLERIFDRYYFDRESSCCFDTQKSSTNPIEVKYKLSK